MLRGGRSICVRFAGSSVDIEPEAADELNIVMGASKTALVTWSASRIVLVDGEAGAGMVGREPLGVGVDEVGGELGVGAVEDIELLLSVNDVADSPPDCWQDAVEERGCDLHASGDVG